MKAKMDDSRPGASPSRNQSPAFPGVHYRTILWTCALGLLAVIWAPTVEVRALTGYTTLCLSATIAVHPSWLLLNSKHAADPATSFANGTYYWFITGTALCAIGLAAAMGRG